MERLVWRREEVERLRLEGLPAGVFADLVEPGGIVAGYRGLLDAPGRWPARRAPAPAPGTGPAGCGSPPPGRPSCRS